MTKPIPDDPKAEDPAASVESLPFFHAHRRLVPVSYTHLRAHET